MTDKYEFTGETKVVFGITLRQIRALIAIPLSGVSVGDVGGWIEKEENLSQASDSAWIYGNAWIYGDARISGHARIYDNAWIYGHAWIYGDARIYKVNVESTRTDGYTFTVAPTPNGPRVIAGCRYLTFKEAKAHWKASRGGTKLGDETMSILKHLETMAKINGFMEPVA